MSKLWGWVLTIFLLLLAAVFAVVLAISLQKTNSLTIINTAKPEPVQEKPKTFKELVYFRHPELKEWKRTPGPLKIGLQAGHWKNDELPDELYKLRGASTGTGAAGYVEWEVVFAIAEEVQRQLEERILNKPVIVEILPATVPPDYEADLFLAIHADGDLDRNARGYRASGFWFDLTDHVDPFLAVLLEEYEHATGLPPYDQHTINMLGYYAFNWIFYKHSVHAMTPGVILETGFLTNAQDRALIVQPEIPAEGIVNAIVRYFDL